MGRWMTVPTGKLTFCHGKSPFLMGKSTISMAIFNSYVKLPEGNHFFFGVGKKGAVAFWALFSQGRSVQIGYFFP